MKSKSIHARFFRNQLAIVTMLFGASCFAEAPGPGQATTPALELGKEMELESATAELQVTLAGNLKDFSVATGGASSPGSRLAQQAKSKLLPRHVGKLSRMIPTMLSCISICHWPWQNLAMRVARCWRWRPQ